jgi:hypothetical protein
MSIKSILQNAAQALRGQAEDLKDSGSKVALATLQPFMHEAAKMLSPRARDIVMAKLGASGLQQGKSTDGMHIAELLQTAHLGIKWNKGKPILFLYLQAGLPDQQYKKMWSLDRGRRSARGKTKPWNIFTLTEQEKKRLGQQVEDLAFKLFKDSQER